MPPAEPNSANTQSTSKLLDFVNLLRKILFLARPYGLKKLLLVFAISLAQGVFQVIGVTSILPFLTVAADPGRIRSSRLGEICPNWLASVSDNQLLMYTGLLAISLLLLSNVINILSEYIRNRYAHELGHWLRLHLVRQISSRGYGYFLNTNSAILHKKVTADVMQYVTGVLLPLLDAFARIATIVLLVLMLLFVDALLALSAFAFLGGFYICIYWFLQSRRSLTAEGLKHANRGFGQEVMQLFAGIKPVKIHRAEGFFYERLNHFSLLQAKYLSWLPVYVHSPRYLVEPLAFGGLVLLVVVLAGQGRDITDVLPTLGVLTLAGYRLIPTLQLLYGQLTQMTTMRHALDEVCDEYLQSLDVGDKTNGNMRDFSRMKPMQWRRAIRLDKVTFNYPGTPRPVLDQVDLTIEKGSSVAIIGETGAGKSTFVDLLLGLHRPDSGAILVDDTQVSEENVAAWRAGIGYVPQDIFLLDDTLACNIAFGISEAAIDEQRLREVCGVAQILDFIMQELPKGFQTQVGDRGVRLSGGQRQRIGLARALYHAPSLLILDEATSALDETTEAAMVQAINMMQGKITMIIIAHRLSTIKGCKQWWKLGEGKMQPVTHHHGAAGDSLGR